MMSSLTDKLLKKSQEEAKAKAKEAKEAKEKQEGKESTDEIINTQSGFVGPDSGPDSRETAGAGKDNNTPSPEVSAELEQADRATKEVARQAGATEVPGSPLLGSAVTGMQSSVTPILEVKKDQTIEEKQTQRTEVDTHVILIDGEPRGSGGFPLTQDPPLGTLPNSNVIYEGDKDSIMTQADQSHAEGRALNQVSDEDNMKALKAAMGEEKRQRMLEGRPTQDDLKQGVEEMEAPAGGYKVIRGVSALVKANGTRVKPQDGYFVPQDEEETKMLDDFVAKGLVEAPTSKQKSKVTFEESPKQSFRQTDRE